MERYKDMVRTLSPTLERRITLTSPTEILGAFLEDVPLPPTPPNEVFGLDQGVETQ
jgi:hypothetical protein